MDLKNVKVPTEISQKARYIGGFLLAAVIGLSGLFFATHSRPAHSDDDIASTQTGQLQVPKGTAEVKTTGSCDVIVTNGSSWEKAKAYAAEQGCHLRALISKVNGSDDSKPVDNAPAASTTQNDSSAADSQAPTSVAEQQPSKLSNILGQIGIQHK